MQVFISEYLCGGAWTEEYLPPSLEREGLAMLRAIVTDFARVTGCQVVTTLAQGRASLGIAGVRERRVSSPIEEQAAFEHLASISDVCLVIAPELGDALTLRCRVVEACHGARLLTPPPDVTRLCSDKLLFARFLHEREILTIETLSLDDVREVSPLKGPVVVKPRFGAGSQDVHTFESAQSAIAAHPETHLEDIEQLIIQPLIPGTAISAGVLFHPDGEQFEVLPPTFQQLSDDGSFVYEGGRVPVKGDSILEVAELVSRVCKQLPGLAGYVGIDLIVPDDSSVNPLIVEINPRLTTSYLGYRELATENLAARLIQPDAWRSPIQWGTHVISFTPDGETERLESTDRVFRPVPARS